MSDDRKREIVIAPSSALAVASRLAERTLAARAARAELVPGGAAPTEVVPIRGRTLVVGADGAGAYPTIRSAVAEARDGDRILVRPGIYRESVTIDRSIEIVGDGDVDAIVVVSDDAPCFVLNGTTGRLARLTLRARGPTYSIEGGRAEGRVWLRDLYWAGFLETPAIEGGSVLVSGGSVVLDGLVLAEAHGVWAKEGASLTIRDSLIRDCRGFGIYVSAGASATIEDNEILGNGGTGIWVSGLGAGPVIRRNKIHNNRDGGIYVADRQTGTIEDNEVYGNGRVVGDAISVRMTGGALMIRRNRIYDCGTGSGIRVSDASPTIDDNEVFAGDVRVEPTINAGIMVWSAASAPVIRRNRVHDWPGDGIAVVLGAAGTIEANDIFGNAVTGVLVWGAGSAPVIRGNSIHDGRGFGVEVRDANGTIENNEIFGNAHSAIMVSGIQTGPTIRGNRIHDNLSCGIQVSEGAAGSIVDNRITGNRSEPIRIVPGASPHLARNVIG